MLSGIVLMVQFFFSVVIGVYFLSLLRGQRDNKECLFKESEKQLSKLRTMRSVKLTTPLCESVRPKTFDEIIGQKDALRALKAALCTPNPQHVLIYGPPGVGKTAAARAAFYEAINGGLSPFSHGAKFIETDATIMRFDERSIADPLIGSVHDPIYQGAGSYGTAGIPQPKPGAVSKAHGGVLFIDEIGELHPIQMNKLLKVLEDRKVMLESAYYSGEDKNIPPHIRDIFENGLPADFRLVGATTRRPEELPPALRSRCVEIFFKPLTKNDVKIIAQNAAKKYAVLCPDGCPERISDYALNGRDAVKILQTAMSCALLEGRGAISLEDIDWVVEFGRYCPRSVKDAFAGRIGRVYALGVSDGWSGAVLEVEAGVEKCERGAGKLWVSGIAEEEEISTKSGSIRRKSNALAAAENAAALLEKTVKIRREDYHMRLNFIGGAPVDGPSAGAAMFCALYGAATRTVLDKNAAITGEITLSGDIKAVGGVGAKIGAAADYGLEKVFIPQENHRDFHSEYGVSVVPVKNVRALLTALTEDSAATPGIEKSAQKSIGA